MCGGLSWTPYWGPDLVHNPGMCPDWELNQQTFGSQAGAQSTEPHQPGLFWFLKNKSKELKCTKHSGYCNKTGLRDTEPT